MLTKTKIALIVALVAGSASAASAQGFDPNPANRYPHYSTPEGRGSMYIGTGSPQSVASQNVAPRGARTLQSAPVRLQQGRNAAPAYGDFQTAPVYGQFGGYGAQQDPVGTDLRDRASSPYAGGVN